MLIPKTKEKVLKAFFFNPSVSLYVREVARKTRVSTQNAHKYLKSLNEVGFLIKTSEHNQVFYKPNLDNPFLVKFFELFEIERREAVRIKKKKLRSKIIKLQEQKSVYCDFGLFMGDKTIIVSAKERSGTWSHKKFQEKLNDPNFFNELMKKRVVVFGEAKFWEFIK